MCVVTEQEWQMQKKAKIDAMEPGIAQFEASRNNGDMNWRPYYVEAAKVDFLAIMGKYGSYANRLDLKYGAQFYPLLQEYLESLSEEDLMRNCTEDPWNIIFTPLSVQRFGTVVTACDHIMP